MIGYAAGDDHLYLVYEYVQNGSLSEHLHDPLLKGNAMEKQPCMLSLISAVSNKIM